MRVRVRCAVKLRLQILSAIFTIMMRLYIAKIPTVIVFVSGAQKQAGISNMWWIFVIVAIILMIAILLLFCCIYCLRYTGETYKGLYQ